MTQLNRRLLVGAIAALPFAGEAHADGPSETFIRSVADQAFALSRANAEAAQFSALLVRVADVQRISRTVLGRHTRSFTPEQQQRFRDAFTRHLGSVLRGSLRGMEPGAFRVTGSVDLRPGDTLVASRAQRSGGDPLTMRWRVLSTPAGQRLVDIEYLGVFLALQQAQEFAAFLDRPGNSADMLIARLAERTQVS
ncbi:MAG: phospholipid-binding protein MlaC [Hyphomonadaceae bacterium]